MNFVLLLLLGIHSTGAVTHSLKYFYTAFSQVPNFPEFVAVGLVDDVQMLHYDSNTKKAVPTQDWMRKNMDQKYWDGQTIGLRGHEKNFKANIEITKQLFNQTGGVHIFQYMYGCEWDEETQTVTSYQQHGYDGEDFLTWNMETNTWIAPKQQAERFKKKWNTNRVDRAVESNYLKQMCPHWLKRYLDYGKSSLMRTDLPSVSLLQKSPSSPVTCHATGFYPAKAEMFWRKSGEELHAHMEKGEIVPNNDGSFQMDVKLAHPSIESEDWTNYECVFQLSGKKDIITKLEKTKIITNKGNFNVLIIPVVVAVVVLVAIALIGFVFYKKKNAKRPPSPVEAGDVQQQMLPQ